MLLIIGDRKGGGAAGAKESRVIISTGSTHTGFLASADGREGESHGNAYAFGVPKYGVTPTEILCLKDAHLGILHFAEVYLLSTPASLFAHCIACASYFDAVPAV